MQQHRFLALGAAVVCLALGACSTQLKKAESELLELSDMLPGRYHDTAQGLRLDIVRLDIPLLTDYAFYVQESAADEPRKINQQRLITFEAVKDGTIVERLYSFAEPARWRNGHLNAGLFTSLMSKDTTPLAGCELVWKKEGDKFVGANNRDTCRVTTPALGSVKVDMRKELSANELGVAELSYSGTKLVQGNAAEPFHRFERGAGP